MRAHFARRGRRGRAARVRLECAQRLLDALGAALEVATVQADSTCRLALVSLQHCFCLVSSHLFVIILMTMMFLFSLIYMYLYCKMYTNLTYINREVYIYMKLNRITSNSTLYLPSILYVYYDFMIVLYFK